MKSDNTQTTESAGAQPHVTFDVSKSWQALPWDAIEERLRHSFRQDTPDVRHAFKKWAEELRISRTERQPKGPTVHIMQSPEVIDALVALFEAYVECLRAEFHSEIANRRVKARAAGLKAAIGEFDGFILDDDAGDQLVPMLGTVERVASSESKGSDLIRSVRAAVEGDETPFPRDFGEGIGDFERDLREFLGDKGEDGKQFILKLCNDVELAKRVKADERQPAPIRFLAGLVIHAA